MTDSRALVALLGQKFIQRKDVKSWQSPDGAWYPDRSKMTMADFEAHLAGTKTMGHYLLDPEGNCKLFAFDLDFVKHDRSCDGRGCKGCPVTFKNLSPTDAEIASVSEDSELPLITGHPRQLWLEGDDTSTKQSMIIQIRSLAEGLARRTNELFGCHVAIAVTGGKGMHVYGFTDSIPAELVRGMAHTVLESFGVFEPFRGQNFWRHRDHYQALDIEVFPKQDSLGGKDLGNLMALPLGIHQVTGQRKYFLSMNTGMNRLREMDPMHALTGDLPWD